MECFGSTCSASKCFEAGGLQHHQEVVDCTAANGMVDAKFPHTKAVEGMYRSDCETQFQNLADPFVHAGDDPCDGSNKASEDNRDSFVL